MDIGGSDTSETFEWKCQMDFWMWGRQRKNLIGGSDDEATQPVAGTDLEDLKGLSEKRQFMPHLHTHWRKTADLGLFASPPELKGSWIYSCNNLAAALRHMSV